MGKIWDFLEEKKLVEKEAIRKTIKAYLKLRPFFQIISPTLGWLRKLYISLFPLIAGPYIGFSWDDIFKEPNLILDNYDFLIYLLILWLFLLTYQFFNAKDQNTKALEDIKSSIINAPDSRAIKSYNEYYDEIQRILNYHDGYWAPNTKEDIETRIKLASEYLIKFIERYFRAYGVKITSNFMIHFPIDLKASNYLETIKATKAKRIVIFRDEPIESYSGVLLLCDQLSFGLHQPNHYYDPIIIPLLKKNDMTGKLVPGATSAFRKGIAIIPDTKKLGEVMKKFEEEDEKSVLENILSKDIRSFLSLRITHKNKAIGVINIDSSVKLDAKTNDYLSTLVSLLHPMTQKFAPSIYKYRNQMYNVELKG